MDNKSPRTRWKEAVMQSSLPPSVRHVLHVISTYSDEKAKPVYPSQEKIGQDTGHKRETVNKLIKKAIQAGFLVCEEAGGPGKNRKSNLYSLHIPESAVVINDHKNNTSYFSFTNYRDDYVTNDQHGIESKDKKNRDLDEFIVIEDHLTSLEDSKERISSNDSFTTLEDVHVTNDHYASEASRLKAIGCFDYVKEMVMRRERLPESIGWWTDELVCKAHDFMDVIVGDYGEQFSQLSNEERTTVRRNFYLSSGITAKEYARHVLPI